MKKIVCSFLVLFLIVGFAQKKSVATKPLSDDQKASYFIGMNIANSIKSQGLNVDTNLLTQAIKDVVSGKKTLLPADSLNGFMQKYMGKKQQEKASVNKKKAQENQEIGAKFLEKNKLNPNVKTTASGLQYEVLTEGDKTNFPVATSKVKVKYTGKLLNGKEFDSTEKNNGGNPIEFPLSNVIKGWTEGVQLMSKGAKYRFYIPSQLAYGESGAGAMIGPGELLLFDVELVDFEKEAPKTEEKPK